MKIWITKSLIDDDPDISSIIENGDFMRMGFGERRPSIRLSSCSDAMSRPGHISSKQLD
jgi:hypothetical protein